ncbi:MAG: 50S ribosomal protein L7/L12 [candidate division CPR2 bacterium GW2011_GWC1_39_9]|uniref:50S ribosomal protein L7/L12 n=1 Tax=candidate division CPR2 bacterium GW2011_GWC2_39_10 TaxID=1618345 RepID=A0A0G0P9R1_UNCC2|nr:MAG: 50S ribosomal protein L7/L12 [candidate division CPR2 bacterium GW2011_GWC2_39_10]KKR33915.1 MAG: 50S ribosomal protein L7/L12 [candidate division CPR2 bacterium GW2011_GWC1_39_9]
MDDREKIEHLSQLIAGAETSILAARQLINELSGKSSPTDEAIKGKALNLNISEGGKIIEGVFDGEHMVGPDQKKYPVPANYSSKSKLVQGDVLKLTVNADGTFIFKQIGPIERKKITGILNYADGDYRVLAEGKAYKILFASITYFKVQPGDHVTLVIPKDGNSEWGAIENVLHGAPEGEESPEESFEKDEEMLEAVKAGAPLTIEEEPILNESVVDAEEEMPSTMAWSGAGSNNADISELLGNEPQREPEAESQSNDDYLVNEGTSEVLQTAIDLEEEKPVPSPPKPVLGSEQEVKELEI